MDVKLQFYPILQDQTTPTFLSLDANFRLCRRKKAGLATMEEKPLYGEDVFADQVAVDQYQQTVDTVNHSAPSVSYFLVRWLFRIYYTIDFSII